MKNWKKYGSMISMLMIDYLYDDSGLIKIDESKLNSLNRDKEFKDNYNYYLNNEELNYELFLFEYDDYLLLSIYDNNPFKSNVAVLNKLLLFNYVLERIFVSSRLLKTIVRPDNISYHFLIDINDIKIAVLENGKYEYQERYLTGKELIEFSIENLFIAKKNKNKIVLPLKELLLEVNDE